MRNIKSIINGQTVGSSLPKIDKYHPATGKVLLLNSMSVIIFANASYCDQPAGELIAQVEPATEDMVDQAVKVAAAAQVLTFPIAFSLQSFLCNEKTHTNTHTHTHSLTHAYTHTYIHTYIHTFIRL